MSQFVGEEFADLRIPTFPSEMETSASMGFAANGFPSELNDGPVMDISGHGLMGLPGDGFLFQHSDYPSAVYDMDFLPLECPTAPSASRHERVADATLDSASAQSSTAISGSYLGCGDKPGKKGSLGNVVKKRGRFRGKDHEVSKDVVHVRARRGQATDSHSLAERVRRERINEKMRCLQALVPGCYKAMGMTVMLDEIINYVQSLQNQVEVRPAAGMAV